MWLLRNGTLMEESVCLVLAHFTFLAAKKKKAKKPQKNMHIVYLLCDASSRVLSET